MKRQKLHSTHMYNVHICILFAVLTYFLTPELLDPCSLGLVCPSWWVAWSVPVASVGALPPYRVEVQQDGMTAANQKRRENNKWTHTLSMHVDVWACLSIVGSKEVSVVYQQRFWTSIPIQSNHNWQTIGSLITSNLLWITAVIDVMLHPKVVYLMLHICYSGEHSGQSCRHNLVLHARPCIVGSGAKL